jgi:hypothetical protein
MRSLPVLFNNNRTECVPLSLNVQPIHACCPNPLQWYFGMIGLLVMSIFGGCALMWLICPSPVICLPYYLKFLTIFVVILGGWLGFSVAGFEISGSLFFYAFL